MSSFYFYELQLITVLLLICDSYMSWSTRFVSLKLFVGFSIFDFVPFWMYGLFDFKATHSLAPRRRIFKLQQEVLKFSDICVSSSSPKLTWRQIFRKSKFENVSVVSFKLIFDIPLLNNLFISFLNVFISLIEVKTLLNNLFIS